jgi:hypothetical protein
MVENAILLGPTDGLPHQLSASKRTLKRRAWFNAAIVDAIVAMIIATWATVPRAM